MLSRLDSVWLLHDVSGSADWNLMPYGTKSCACRNVGHENHLHSRHTPQLMCPHNIHGEMLTEVLSPILLYYVLLQWNCLFEEESVQDSLRQSWLCLYQRDSTHQILCCSGSSCPESCDIYATSALSEITSYIQNKKPHSTTTASVKDMGRRWH